MLNIFYIHFIFFTIFLRGRGVFIYLWATLLNNSSLLYLVVPIFDGSYNWNYLEVTLDSYSLIFSRIVILIAAVVSWFSFYYFTLQNTKLVGFLTIKLLFVLRIIVVINFRDLFSIILGWDALGFSSFFLIIFYQRNSSISSASFTLIMNRLGDGTFLLSLGLLSSFSYSIYNYLLIDYTLVFLLMLTFITKRALFPFSRWLPIAIAAPTPISALVHSSTLVTAGLYLMIRFSFYFYRDIAVIKIIFLTRVFTSFYAGVAALVENDLKKIIALSTLRHLGFIGMRFSLGLVRLTFFHLLRHALFKSLLFIRIGDIITLYSHSQDSRLISSTGITTPYSVSLMRLRLLRLFGLPSLSGFFRKELILEFILFRSNSIILYLVVVINILLTFNYTFFLIRFSYRSIKITPFRSCYKPSNIYIAVGTLLSVVSITFGIYYLRVIVRVPMVCRPYFLKLLPLYVLRLVARLNIYDPQFKLYYSPATRKYLNSIFGLHIFISKLIKIWFIKKGVAVNKSVELGLWNSIVNVNGFNSARLLTIKFMTTFLESSYKFLIIIIFLITLYF